MKSAVVFAILLPASVLCLRRDEACVTPNGENAKCSSINTCTVIKNALLKPNASVVEFAQKSQCGYDSEPLVCCGTSAVIIESAACVTPNKENASCLPLKSCSTIYDAVLTRDTEIMKFAKESQCGHPSQPMVCCGSQPYFVYTSTTPLLPDRTVCGIEQQADRIFGGEITQLWEFPWMVLLRYKSTDGTDEGFKCGGTLINNRYVLTAAHCVRTDERTGYELDSVRLGEWKISSENDCDVGLANEECADPVLDVGIEEKIIHDEFNVRTTENDIALLRLDKSIKYTRYIQPICLPSQEAWEPKAGTEMFVAGWGKTENSSQSDYKLKVKIPVVENQACIRKGQRGSITNRQLCAGGIAGKDSCVGDSGGPIMGSLSRDYLKNLQWYQEGIISWGIGCGTGTYPAIYTRVAYYMDWIVAHLKAF